MRNADATVFPVLNSTVRWVSDGLRRLVYAVVGIWLANSSALVAAKGAMSDDLDVAVWSRVALCFLLAAAAALVAFIIERRRR